MTRVGDKNVFDAYVKNKYITISLMTMKRTIKTRKNKKLSRKPREVSVQAI